MELNDVLKTVNEALKSYAVLTAVEVDEKNIASVREALSLILNASKMTSDEKLEVLDELRKREWVKDFQ